MTSIEILAQYASTPATGGIGIGYWVLIIASGAASWFAGHMLKSRFAQHSNTPFQLSGREVAERMLRESGITDVEVISTPGQLTDHYNPADKTVNLSEAVYSQRNVAAAAVAAHECGHAVQHAQAYAFLTMRSKMVPLLSLTSNFTPFLLMGGIMLMAASGNKTLLLLGIIAMAVSVLFSFITLPVEFDASKRAMVWLRSSGAASSMDYDKSQNALFWAAMTYVVGALAALGQLLYYVSIFLNRRDE